MIQDVYTLITAVMLEILKEQTRLTACGGRSYNAGHYTDFDAFIENLHVLS